MIAPSLLQVLSNDRPADWATVTALLPACLLVFLPQQVDRQGEDPHMQICKMRCMHKETTTTFDCIIMNAESLI